MTTSISLAFWARFSMKHIAVMRYSKKAHYEPDWIGDRLDDLHYQVLCPLPYTTDRDLMVGALLLLSAHSDVAKLICLLLIAIYSGGVDRTPFQLALDTFKLDRYKNKIIVSPYDPNVDVFYRANGFSEYRTNYAVTSEMAIVLR